jgi:ATP-dependent DNA helicase RecG
VDTNNKLQILLNQLIASWENEVIEFKNVRDSYSTTDIGKYFSALANEANLRQKNAGWLVFGVDDKTRQISDCDYRRDKTRLDALKHQIAQSTEPGVSFREIYELQTSNGRVVLFEIPPAPLGMPISWNGHYFARAGESLTALGIDKLDTIRAQTINTDWTAVTIPQATINHLDSEALKIAQDNFYIKHANRFSRGEVSSWTTTTFLDRCKLTVDGQLTRAALLLLGKDESSYLLTPHPAEITWKLIGEEQTYEHFHLPFLLSTTRLFQRIRNTQIRILPEKSLLAVEIAKYDQRIVLEALHNCIAHQDYSKNARIVVTESLDRLIFTNLGSFYQGTPSDYIGGQTTPTRYRNPWLTQAMAKLNMIDTIGYGIHQMHVGQAKRFFPLPDYDLSNLDSVSVTIHGSVVDTAYSRVLIQNTSLSLDDIRALDRVQKKLPISDTDIKRLRRAKLIEGNKPNVHVSASIASATFKQTEYIQTRAQDNDFYAKMLIDFLSKFGSADRDQINKLLLDKLSIALNAEQKENQIRNLLNKMRKTGKIENIGGRKTPKWVVRKDISGDPK